MVNSYKFQTDLNNTKLFTKLGANPLNQNTAPKTQEPIFVDQVFHGCRYTPVHRASHGGRDWNEKQGVCHMQRNTEGGVRQCKSGSWEDWPGK